MGGMKELAAMRRRQAQFFNEEMGGGTSRRRGSDESSENEELEKEGEKEDQVSPRGGFLALLLLTCA